ncbi:ComF family protein [Vallitalea okinawensis]|uniref:ComF family protein n=1 Tax=Vallitalea okinawensis TaxID=2078660 RepID=UPI000CFAB6C6|nr:ComF family protein [Vallitalea okinawensis]
MMKVFNGLLDLIFPPRCLLCDELLTVKERHVCEACDIHRFINDGHRCIKCGRLVDSVEERCEVCKEVDYSFDQGFALLQYEGIIHTTFYRLKYGKRKEIGTAFGKMMAKYLEDEIDHLDISVIIPVPLHPSREMQRGYNQAGVIAKTLAKELNLPVDINYLLRIKATKPQSSLNLRGRQNNLKNAFSISNQQQYEQVLLIDDIYTSGNTMDQCAKVLKEAGTKKVYFITAAIANQHR